MHRRWRMLEVIGLDDALNPLSARQNNLTGLKMGVRFFYDFNIHTYVSLVQFGFSYYYFQCTDSKFIYKRRKVKRRYGGNDQSRESNNARYIKEPGTLQIKL